MSERILKEARAVYVELILNRLPNFRALCRRALEHAIDVGKVYIEAHWAGADGGRAGVSLPHAGILVGQHDVRISDLQLSVTDLAVRTIHETQFRRTENFIVVF